VKLTFRQIRTLHAILTTGSVSGAAEMLSLTQPAVSKTLHQLETEIGHSLFKRTKGHLEPEPDVSFLFDELNHTLQGLNRLDKLVRNAGTGHPEHMIIASLPGPSNFLIPQILKEFYGVDNVPKISLRTRTTAVIRELVSTQQVDIGVLVDPPASPNYDVFPVPVEYVCAINDNDVLANRPQITASDLDGRPLITAGSTHVVYEHLKNIFEKSGAVFNPMHEVPFYMPGLGLTLAGFGVAIVDTITAWTYENTARGQGLTFRPLNPVFYDRLAVVSPRIRPLSKSTLSFRDALVTGIERIDSAYQN
jgi:DNA-binding transcriptional LysR family regulator